MPDFKKNINLRPYNTFGIAAEAALFVNISTEDELEWLVEQDAFRENRVLWLGGGSNMLLSGDFPGLVVKLDLKGRELEPLDEDRCLLHSAAGENWHELVLYSLGKDLGGLENLALIPGNAGTAPIQNIGAYGVELKDVFHSLRAFDLKTQQWREFDKKACQFGYRQSYFKKEGKGRFIITGVQLILSRRNHQLRTEYGSLRSALAQMSESPSIHSIAKTVEEIRRQKLPSPDEIGNSGSFFKNPVVSRQKYEALQKDYPEISAYPLDNDQVKLAAGWMIEKAGWKGYRRGDAGVHDKQALVLVNHGHAKGTDIETLANDIIDSIFHTFGVELEPEVNIIKV